MIARPTPPVTVIVPCYNEEAGLPALLARLHAMHDRAWVGDWGILFVDDGSTDNTFAALLQAAREHDWMEVVRHPENLGLGAALRTGFAHARSPVVCTIDSDCSYPPERLPELTALLSEGDLVTASAWHPATPPASGDRMRLLLSRMVSGLYKALIGQDVYTFTCLFRAYRRSALDRIQFRAAGFSAVAEIMLNALLAGEQVREVPMPLEARRFGGSKLKLADAVLAHLYLLSLTTLAVAGRQLRAVWHR